MLYSTIFHSNLHYSALWFFRNAVTSKQKGCWKPSLGWNHPTCQAQVILPIILVIGLPSCKLIVLDVVNNPAFRDDFPKETSQTFHFLYVHPRVSAPTEPLFRPRKCNQALRELLCLVMIWASSSMGRLRMAYGIGLTTSIRTDVTIFLCMIVHSIYSWVGLLALEPYVFGKFGTNLLAHAEANTDPHDEDGRGSQKWMFHRFSLPSNQSC